MWNPGAHGKHLNLMFASFFIISVVSKWIELEQQTDIMTVIVGQPDSVTHPLFICKSIWQRQTCWCEHKSYSNTIVTLDLAQECVYMYVYEKEREAICVLNRP